MSKNTDMTFEQAYTKLENIVSKMEKGDIPLDECMKMYEQAFELLNHCKKKLEECKGTITDINERLGSMTNSADSLFED